MSQQFPDVTLQVHQIRTDLQAIERMVHELAARLDSAFPGADVLLHHSEHFISQHKAEKQRAFWGSIWEKSFLGTVVAIVVVVLLISALRYGILR